MKKLLITALALILSVCTWAAKAWRMPLTVTQPDGTSLQAYQHGDEHFNWYTDKDGVILIRKADIFYIAHIDRYGKISSSNLLAHEKSQRQDAEKRAVAAQNRNLFFERAQQRIETRAMRREPVQVNSTFFPHTGSPKAIVILAQYKDTPFTLTNPRQSFQQFLNGKGRPTDYGHGEGKNASSVQQYFKDMSFGQFTPQFDVYGPVTLPHDLAYYGGTDSNGGDEEFDKLITDACRLMDDSLDFANYDANGDGYADLVYVVYSGYGQNMGAPDNTMWAKSGTIYPTPSFDGKKICRVGISSELIGSPTYPEEKMISGIGLFCHEFSHCMGLPDFYPTLASARGDNQGMEAWSLMDDGEYIANGGRWPTAYTAWEREAMGWMTIDDLTTAQQIELKTIDNKGKAYRIYNDNDPNKKDYYIVQNIQAKRWNAGLESHGLLMYHVNYEALPFTLSSNSVNNEKGKPRMTVIPADGRLYSSYNGNSNKYKEELKGDLFPGTKNVTELTDANKLPNYAPWTWTGGTLDKPIYNISEKEGIVYFDFLKKFSTQGIVPTFSQEATSDKRIFSLDGKYIGTDKSILPQGIYIIGGKKVYIHPFHY
ncbi:M6 family metalloprotease domain protein [Prevotella sp. BV3P1]|uniref:M6 family metalloprotease domain-containing protein n=1 Tax=Prevotellaceae TaxID=171552 RepID=UPI0003B7E10D|nr:MULTISPECIES: M6 family metalloprotease domain-containing protein [Prevotellaceae]ERT60078.1 M6 family metalloprotease domain protein [Prevotella sp. BV3P1]KGF42346.1 peptidase M6 [Hoylesella buccalis DNF00985]